MVQRYNFSSEGVSVYNPYSFMRMLVEKEFKSYWFETGTPSFLIRLIKERAIDLWQLSNNEVFSSDFSTFKVENLKVTPLLYQTGYLTIKHHNVQLDAYWLDYANYEVERSFMGSLLKGMYPVGGETNYVIEFGKALMHENLEIFFTQLKKFVASVPYDLKLDAEKYYQNLFYILFKLVGLTINAEVHTNICRIDATIKYENQLYIFEFKLNQNATIALEQIKERKYYEQYADTDTVVYMVGVNFSTKDRNIDDWLAKSFS